MTSLHFTSLEYRSQGGGAYSLPVRSVRPAMVFKHQTGAQNMGPGAAGSCRELPGAAGSCTSNSNRNSVQERCRNVLWLWQQQKQRPGALQERSVAPATAAETASGRVLWSQQQQKQRQGALQERSVAPAAAQRVQERCRNVLGLWQQRKQRPGTFCGASNSSRSSVQLQEHSVAPAAAGHHYVFLFDESFHYKAFMVGCFARALYNLDLCVT